MNTHWLYLSPKTFLFIDRYKLLLYNSKEYKYLEIDNNAFINYLYDHMNILENLYCIEISEQNFLLHNKIFKAIIDNGFGDYKQATIEDRPVSFMPICKIHKDMSSIKADYKESQAGYILDFLHEITFYLTGEEEGITEYSKQTLYPVQCNLEIDCFELVRFINILKGACIQNINISCNFKSINKYSAFFEILKRIGYHVNFFARINDIISLSFIPEILKAFQISVIYTGMEKPIENENYNHTFIVTNTQELDHALFYQSRLNNLEIVPVYSGNNIDFFTENIFTTKEDLLSLNLTKREIFARKEINTNFFGKFTVFPNGKIYSNTYDKPLGTITDSMYEILYKELSDGYAWMLTRDKKAPCSNCRFKYICPPISCYEFAINKFNLCHIPCN